MLDMDIPLNAGCLVPLESQFDYFLQWYCQSDYNRM